MSNHDIDLEAYRQANADLRHYTGLRFTVLGAFVAISGGLFVLAGQKLQQTRDFSALALFAIALALAFGVLEWRINAVAEFYAAKVDALAEQLGMSRTASSAPQRSVLGKWLAPGVMFVIYGGSTMMWLYAWLA
jgi:hypothetical protein